MELRLATYHCLRPSTLLWKIGLELRGEFRLLEENDRSALRSAPTKRGSYGINGEEGRCLKPTAIATTLSCSMTKLR